MAKAKSKSGFNLAKLDTITACNKPIEIEIKDISGEGTGVFFSIVGKDSDAVRHTMRALADAEIQQDAAGESGGSDVDRSERRQVAMCAAATVGWRTGDDRTIEWGDECLDFSEGNAARVYRSLLPLREQVAASLFNLSLFMKG